MRVIEVWFRNIEDYYGVIAYSTLHGMVLGTSNGVDKMEIPRVYPACRYCSECLPCAKYSADRK